jgi:hypothetical protein
MPVNKGETYCSKGGLLPTHGGSSVEKEEYELTEKRTRASVNTRIRTVAGEDNLLNLTENNLTEGSADPWSEEFLL